MVTLSPTRGTSDSQNASKESDRCEKPMSLKSGFAGENRLNSIRAWRGKSPTQHERGTPTQLKRNGTPETWQSIARCVLRSARSRPLVGTTTATPSRPATWWYPAAQCLEHVVSTPTTHKRQSTPRTLSISVEKGCHSLPAAPHSDLPRPALVLAFACAGVSRRHHHGLSLSPCTTLATLSSPTFIKPLRCRSPANTWYVWVERVGSSGSLPPSHGGRTS